MGAQKPTRVWVDGCFDMQHFGHANAMRQAKAMGDILIVGVHSDAEILKNKGPTVMQERERYDAVAACRWVDQVVEDAPYVTQLETLDQHDIDFVVHGDDITTNAEGVDAYHLVKAAGRYCECKRTVGVSTTDLVGRMLLLTKDHLKRPTVAFDENEYLSIFSREELQLFSSATNTTKQTTVSFFFPKENRILPFIQGDQPKENACVGYVDGGFDLFHVGHVSFLKQAKQLCDYLIVGVHDDDVINKVKGSNNPIMNLRERVLGVLSCRYVDHIVIGAPYSVTESVLKAFPRVDIVAHGITDTYLDQDGTNPYELPMSLGIFRQVDNPYSTLTTAQIVARIIEHKRLYEERNARKLTKAILEEKLKTDTNVPF